MKRGPDAVRAFLVFIGRPRAANDCDTCLDDRSCASSVFSCSVECAGLLP